MVAIGAGVSVCVGLLLLGGAAGAIWWLRRKKQVHGKMVMAEQMPHEYYKRRHKMGQDEVKELYTNQTQSKYVELEHRTRRVELQ
ncbi:hypothetical protein K469DRAFT_705460 [Zopfia rhizophila CBS 207.26]|uniref:Uncharacterized protein n=1 Tax=Zopfia rhizophila CBS 207.26 TaxID=1314779 RepID=A0A6A6E9W1_9PEZI|nr:hypothetical protein K469DRAFT_705460 [Zopfia rhizophila CBS 207.26]